MRDKELHKAARRGALDAVPESLAKKLVEKIVDPEEEASRGRADTGSPVQRRTPQRDAAHSA